MAITTYLRSSSMGSWDMCEHKGFLEYTLGMKSGSNIKAEKGNIVHKVLECLARKKKCEQEGLTEFDGEDLGIIQVADCDPIKLLDMAYAFSTANAKQICWSSADYRECLRWVNKALNYKCGMFDPRNLDILMPEQRFDLVIPYEWAKFDYKLPNGTEIKGQLSVKGTMDLITDLGKNTIEVTDYKTGKRMDWATGATKDFKKLLNDKQLMLYFYATSLLYPEKDCVLSTMYFINDGGPYTLSFTKHDLPRIEEMLKASFEKMKLSLVPRQTVSWKCDKLCLFSKPSAISGGKSVCNFIHDKIVQEGIAQVTQDYANGASWDRYGDGGGRKENPQSL
jgi:ATP-dependent helicase/DNAse subunit B